LSARAAEASDSGNSRRVSWYVDGIFAGECVSVCVSCRVGVMKMVDVVVLLGA